MSPYQIGTATYQAGAGSHTRPENGIETLRFAALGSECELFAVDPTEPLSATADWIRRMHAKLTRFDPESELSRFNARAGEWVEVSSELEALLRAALASFEESEGLVHAGILPSLVRAGYDRTFDRIRAGVPSGHAGKPHQIGASPHQIGARSHQIGAGRHQLGARFRQASEDVGEPTRLVALPDLLQVRPRGALLRPGAALDLGGLAKGWIADRAVERMGPNGLANCGGDLRAVGGGPTGEGWPVAFGGKTLALDDHGAATSGTTKRSWGDGAHHLIDPRTGAPARSDLTEVSALAKTALEAEVLAKTALLLGSGAAERALERRALAWALA